jgi:hypothetical protein
LLFDRNSGRITPQCVNKNIFFCFDEIVKLLKKRAGRMAIVITIACFNFVVFYILSLLLLYIPVSICETISLSSKLFQLIISNYFSQSRMFRWACLKILASFGNSVARYICNWPQQLRDVIFKLLNRFQEIDFASLYPGHVGTARQPYSYTGFLSPIDCSKIPALAVYGPSGPGASPS